MATRHVDKGSPEWMAFMDLWDIYKKVGTPEVSEKYWHELVWTHASQYLEKYKDIPQFPIFKRMILGLCDGLDEMCKE